MNNNYQHIHPNGSLFIFLYGREHCRWSRQFWTTWIESSIQLRANSLVEIDAENAPMRNYTVTVFGFPTLLRVTSNDFVDALFRNRTVEELFTWVVNNGGVAPLEYYGATDIYHDDEWLGWKRRCATVSHRFTRLSNWVLVTMRLPWHMWYCAEMHLFWVIDF